MYNNFILNDSYIDIHLNNVRIKMYERLKQTLLDWLLIHYTCNYILRKKVAI